MSCISHFIRAWGGVSLRACPAACFSARARVAGRRRGVGRYRRRRDLAVSGRGRRLRGRAAVRLLGCFARDVQRHRGLSDLHHGALVRVAARDGPRDIAAVVHQRIQRVFDFQRLQIRLHIRLRTAQHLGHHGRFRAVAHRQRDHGAHRYLRALGMALAHDLARFIVVAELVLRKKTDVFRIGLVRSQVCIFFTNEAGDRKDLHFRTAGTHGGAGGRGGRRR